MDKLCRYNNYNPTTGEISGTEKPVYAYFDESSIPADYTDINSIENLNDFGFNLEEYDYKRVRDLIKAEVDSIGFGSLTASQKVIAATHKIGTHAERLAAFGGNVDTLVLVGVDYHSKVSEVRRIRMAYGISCVHNHLEHITLEINVKLLQNDPTNFQKQDNSGLTTLDVPPVSPTVEDRYIVGSSPSGDWIGQEGNIAEWNGSNWFFVPRIFVTLPEWILKTIDPDNLLYKYLDLGLGGFIDGDNATGLLDYINSTTGTTWQGSGLRSEPYTPEGLADMSAFADKMLDILQKGIY